MLWMHLVLLLLLLYMRISARAKRGGRATMGAKHNSPTTPTAHMAGTASSPDATTLHIGFDDTDSPVGMCTTYLAYKIAGIIKKHKKSDFIDYPRLIRFNPNIPWKTRGNGAVSFLVQTRDPRYLKQKVISAVQKYSDTDHGANPGLAFYSGGPTPPPTFTDFSQKALWRLISRRYAKRFVLGYQRSSNNNNAPHLETFHMGNGQGLIGAVGSIGYLFDGDSTVELLTYRKKSMFGKTRKITASSVQRMQQKSWPNTFNSFDTKKKKILMAPHGPDPVFYGLRGESVSALYSASKILVFDEKLDGHMIFRSNQGTNDHLKNKINVQEFAPYTSGVIHGTVSVPPSIHVGGHVMFSLLTQDNIKVNCAVYKPTGLAPIALNLILRDKIMVGGGIRKATRKHPTRILNVEFIEILKLQPHTTSQNPRCTKCQKSMKSKGHGQGFFCSRCKTTAKSKVSKTTPRSIKKQRYIPVVSAHRHLTRPQQRTNYHNKDIVFDKRAPWYLVYNKKDSGE